MTGKKHLQIETRKVSNKGGYLSMPLRQNVPEGHKGWKLVKCPKCDQKCCERPLSAGFARDMFLGNYVRGAVKKGGYK